MVSKLIITFILLCLPVAAFGRVPSGGSGGHFQANMFNSQKKAQKESSQWTLADWLAQKNKMAWWDNWLAMNRSATIFELNVGAAHNKYTLTSTDPVGAKTDAERDAQFYNLDFYITLFNIYGEYELTSNSRESWSGAAGLRLFGTSSQTTSLVGRYGWRKLADLDVPERWENLWAEGELQIYILSFFGVEGRYRKIFSNKSNLGKSLEGSRKTAGAFLEFLSFRIFGDVYQESTEFKDSAGWITSEERKGYEAGLKIYF